MARDFSSLPPSSTNPFGRVPRRRKARTKEGRRAEAAPFWRLAQVRAWLAGRDWGRIALLVGTVSLLSALLSLHLLPDRVSLRKGDLSAQDIRAVRPVRYLDVDATNQFKAEAAAHVEPIYSSVHTASEADETITEAYGRLRRDQALKMDPDRAATELRREVGLVLPAAALAPLLDARRGAFHLDQAERQTHQVVHDALDREIRNDHPDDLAEARALAAGRLRASLLPRTYVPAAVAVARATIQPNRLLDKGRTNAAVLSAERLVSPIYGQVFAGDLVVRHDQVVTDTTIAKLRALGLQNPRLDPRRGRLCIAGLVAFMVGLVCFWLSRDYPGGVRLHQDPRVTPEPADHSSASSACVWAAPCWASGCLPSQFGYVGMVWVAATGMLIAALIKPRVAMLITALLAAQSAVLLGGDLRFSLLTRAVNVGRDLCGLRHPQPGRCACGRAD